MEAIYEQRKWRREIGSPTTRRSFTFLFSSLHSTSQMCPSIHSMRYSHWSFKIYFANFRMNWLFTRTKCHGTNRVLRKWGIELSTSFSFWYLREYFLQISTDYDTYSSRSQLTIEKESKMDFVWITGIISIDSSGHISFALLIVCIGNRTHSIYRLYKFIHIVYFEPQSEYAFVALSCCVCAPTKKNDKRYVFCYWINRLELHTLSNWHTRFQYQIIFYDAMNRLHILFATKMRATWANASTKLSKIVTVGMSTMSQWRNFHKHSKFHQQSQSIYIYNIYTSMENRIPDSLHPVRPNKIGWKWKKGIAPVMLFTSRGQPNHNVIMRSSSIWEQCDSFAKARFIPFIRLGPWIIIIDPSHAQRIHWSKPHQLSCNDEKGAQNDNSIQTIDRMSTVRSHFVKWEEKNKQLEQSDTLICNGRR